MNIHLRKFSKDNSQKANMARAALIGVVLGNPDPTNGSRFWDGSDFLAWGTGAYKDPKGIERVAHPKFFFIHVLPDFHVN